MINAFRKLLYFQKKPIWSWSQWFYVSPVFLGLGPCDTVCLCLRILYPLPLRSGSSLPLYSLLSCVIPALMPLPLSSTVTVFLAVLVYLNIHLCEF